MSYLAILDSIHYKCVIFIEDKSHASTSSDRTVSKTQDDKLLKILDEYDIGSLYTKFCEGGVTTKVLWDLTDEILEDIGLTKLEKLSYLKGKRMSCRARTSLIRFSITSGRKKRARS